MRGLLVKNWMTTNIVVAPPDMGMLEAHKMMRKRQIRRLPIVKKNNKLVGIVTRSDVRQAEPSDASTLNVWEMTYLLAELKLKSIMTKDVITVTADDTIKTAATLMHKHKIGALPVIDEKGRLVGILTESDVFRILIAWFNEELAERE